MASNCYYVSFSTLVILTLFYLVPFLWTLNDNSGTTRQPTGVYGHVRGAQRTTTAYNSIPLLYIITPTVQRLEQKADLTRLSNTLRHVPRLHWVVIEDAANKTAMVTRLLKNCKLPYTHLNAKTPVGDAARKLYNMSRVPHRGVLPRNAGLDWVSTNAEFPSVLYFADDDNTYDLQLFEEMRYAQKIAVWPVGLVGGAKYESPAIKNGKVLVFYTLPRFGMGSYAYGKKDPLFRTDSGSGTVGRVVGWIVSYDPSREFACDMAGFAVNTKFYMKAERPLFSITEKKTIENAFLKRFHVALDELEPKADNCTKVLVWHTKTVNTGIAPMASFERLRSKYSAPALEV